MENATVEELVEQWAKDGKFYLSTRLAASQVYALLQIAKAINNAVQAGEERHHE